MPVGAKLYRTPLKNLENNITDYLQQYHQERSYALGRSLLSLALVQCDDVRSKIMKNDLRSEGAGGFNLAPSLAKSGHNSATWGHKEGYRPKI
eukprot:scaffold11290_cov66-Skeletonema_marinoi.AAC.1